MGELRTASGGGRSVPIQDVVPREGFEAFAMELQSMGDKAVTSENVPSIDNLRAHSPQIPDDNRPQPDTSAIDAPHSKNPSVLAGARCAAPHKVRPSARLTFTRWSW